MVNATEDAFLLTFSYADLLHSHIQTSWDTFLSYTSDDCLFIYTWGLALLVTATYWFFGAFYSYLDIFNPKWAQRIKVQPGKNDPVELSKWLSTAKQVLINMLIIAPLLNIVLFPLVVIEGGCRKEQIHTVPPFSEIVLHLLGCIMIREFCFYHLHRMLHWPLFYEKVHKFHHRWPAPIAIGALYATPFEHVLTNLLPMLIPIAILKCKLFVTTVFLLNAILATLQDHGGYKIPFYYDYTRHNKHHELSNVNFGNIGLLDWVYGTHYLSKKKYKTH